MIGEFDQSFNVIHARCVCTGIRDFKTFLGQLRKALRPGGVLLLLEGDAVIYGNDLQPMTFTDETDSVSALARTPGL